MDNQPELKPFISEFQGRPVLNLPTGNIKFPYFSFGLNKARAIVANIDVVKEYITQCEKLLEEQKED